VDLQDSIVGRDRFKRDICMPPNTGKLTWLCQRVNSWSEAFLLLDTGNNADLITKLAVGLGNGMDMETRRLGLMICLLADVLARRVNALTLPVRVESFSPRVSKS
jgi:hypothetical protein